MLRSAVEKEIVTATAKQPRRRVKVPVLKSKEPGSLNLTTAEIEGYVDRYHPFDKAGAYAIQEWIGVVGIRRIEGDFYNVMGLPVSRVVRGITEF